MDVPVTNDFNCKKKLVSALLKRVADYLQSFSPFKLWNTTPLSLSSHTLYIHTHSHIQRLKLSSLQRDIIWRACSAINGGPAEDKSTRSFKHTYTHRHTHKERERLLLHRNPSLFQRSAINGGPAEDKSIKSFKHKYTHAHTGTHTKRERDYSYTAILLCFNVSVHQCCCLPF